LNSEPRQRLKSSSSIDASQLLKANKPMTVVPKVPAVLVAKELSDIVIYTQAIKFRGEFLFDLTKCTIRFVCLGLSTSTSTIVAGGKTIRKIPKRNIQLVAQPSTTSTSMISTKRLIERKKNEIAFEFSGTESSRSIDQVSPAHQIVSLIENKAKKLCKNQAVDMILYENCLFFSLSKFNHFLFIFSHTETQLVRCYPSGFRVDSSNFNPLHLWTYGIQ